MLLPLLHWTRALTPRSSLLQLVAASWSQSTVHQLLQMRCTTWHRWGLCTLVLIAFALNLRLLDRYPLREDEAIYSIWALHFWQHDPLLLTVWPDKPPLFYWTLAPLLQLFGATGAGARWLNIALSILTPLVVGASARQLCDAKAGLVAAMVMALNPFALSFAATVYTDPLLVFCGQLALYCALSGWSLGAGLWLSAAMMTKQQGVLYLPLVVGSLLLYSNQTEKPSFSLDVAKPIAPAQVSRTAIKNSVFGSARSIIQRRNRSGERARWQTFLHFALGMGIVIAPILYWDSLRWQVAPSPWDLGVRNYGAVTLLPPAQWLVRWAAWWPLLWHLVASNALWIMGALLGLGACWPVRSTTDRSTNFIPILLLLWSMGFCLLHLVSSVQVWDRYLLPLAPMVALMAAWAWRYRPQPYHYRQWQGISALVLLLLVPPALKAANGGFPLGGDHGDYAGLVEATKWLRAYAPTNVILYHQQLGWQEQFYFYTEQTTKRYELRWFPNPVYLADNAAKSPYKRRFLIQPQWSAMRNFSLHMTTRNLRLIERQRWGMMVLYEISEGPQSPCAWCLCQLQTLWPSLIWPATPGEASRP